ncbi:MAG: MFS transporter, partial [Rickettsiales bacterium]
SIYSGVTIFSAVAILFLGHLIDKISLHKYITAICAALIAGCLLISKSEWLPLFILGLGMVRFLGQGVMTHLSSTVTARYVHEGRGKGLGMVSLGMPLGETFLPLLATLAIASIGWRESWLIYAAFYALLAWPLLMKLAPKRDITLPDELDQTLHAGTSAQNALRDPVFWSVILAGLIMPFLMTGVFFHQHFIMDSLGFSQELYAGMFVLFGSTRIIWGVLAGNVVDKYGSAIVLKLMLVPFLLALLLIMWLPNPITLGLWMFSMALSAGSFTPAQGSFLAERYGVKKLGSLKSVLTSCMVLSTACAPALFGYVIDKTENMDIIFAICLGCTLLAMGFAFTKLRD